MPPQTAFIGIVKGRFGFIKEIRQEAETKRYFKERLTLRACGGLARVL